MTTTEQSKITHPIKLAFLQNYLQCKYITDTCRAVGVSSAGFYKWLNTDKIFSGEVETIKKEIKQRRLDELEAELHSRAMGSKSKQSDILLMFELKAEAPEKYREKPPETRLIGDITVKLAVPPYTDNPVLPEARKQISSGSAIIDSKEGQ